MSPPSKWQDGQVFHDSAMPVYTGDRATCHQFKRAEHMAHVRYAPSHPNPQFADARAGAGINDCVWVACEQGAQAEGLCKSALDALLDSRLSPHAAVGWHAHVDTEEIYYLLEGSLHVSVQDEHGETRQYVLGPGDSHRVGPGMAHFAQAGQEGARFLAVIIRAA